MKKEAIKEMMEKGKKKGGKVMPKSKALSKMCK